MRSHHQEIIDQFTRQAIPFTQVAGHHDAIDTLIEMVAPNPEDTVLDVACGPGLVACAFARHCAQVTGLDVTPAMIDLARSRQDELGLGNIAWQTANCLPLPFDNGQFTVVVTRYSLHHFRNPAAVLQEMIRVCSPGGKILLADIAMAPDKVRAFDQMEIRRDPSHVHALTTEEFAQLLQQSGLLHCRRTQYQVAIELEAQLKASFPKPGDSERLRRMITDDIGINRLGINPQRRQDQVWYTIPVAVYVGLKPSRTE